jgi:hypothetical protein
MRIIFALKNPTASTGFEPANLGTKGQHATSRPQKPLANHILHIVPKLQTSGYAKGRDFYVKI